VKGHEGEVHNVNAPPRPPRVSIPNSSRSRLNFRGSYVLIGFSFISHQSARKQGQILHVSIENHRKRGGKPTLKRKDRKWSMRSLFARCSAIFSSSESCTGRPSDIVDSRGSLPLLSQAITQNGPKTSQVNGGIAKGLT